jgi:hypothetical protein
LATGTACSECSVIVADKIRRCTLDRRLGNINAELKQLTVNVGRTPKWVLKAHSPNKVAHLFIDLRSATERTVLPSPAGREAHSMPSHDGLRSDDGYGIKVARKTSRAKRTERDRPSLSTVDMVRAVEARFADAAPEIQPQAAVAISNSRQEGTNRKAIEIVLIRWQSRSYGRSSRSRRSGSQSRPPWPLSRGPDRISGQVFFCYDAATSLSGEKKSPRVYFFRRAHNWN